MWDNHEFSWMGWQGQQRFDRRNRPAQTRKVAANQAWFEYQPARVERPGRHSLDRFEAPEVKDAPIQTFDAQGLGTETNNLVAIDSLIGYRSLQWGRHLDLIITDQHSYRSEEPTSRPEAAALDNADFPELIPQEIMETLDAGRLANDGHPPETLQFGERRIANFRRQEPPQTILGQRQKQWFLEQLRNATRTWKVWGNSLGTLDFRVDPQNLPSEIRVSWPGAGYACFGGGGDYGTAYRERAEIYDAIRNGGITNFLSVSGDRHSFWAGLASKALPPARFEPIGAAFITGSISAAGLVEAFEHAFPKQHPLRALYIADVDGKQEPAVNLLLHHGVRTCLEYARTGDAIAARRFSNLELAPHLQFVDMGGHGYATLRVGPDSAECEFVCIPRPIERSSGEDGGPLRYRVVHRVSTWKRGQRPVLKQRMLEGDATLSL
jgi:alkaline phosphatase D